MVYSWENEENNIYTTGLQWRLNQVDYVEVASRGQFLESISKIPFPCPWWLSAMHNGVIQLIFKRIIYWTGWVGECAMTSQQHWENGDGGRIVNLTVEEQWQTAANDNYGKVVMNSDFIQAHVSTKGSLIKWTGRVDRDSKQ